MQIGNFAVTIPEGHEKEDGYVHMKHGTQYTIVLRNHYQKRRCDAEVSVDGKVVGNFRVDENQSIHLERAPHDHGRFTFYKADSSEAGQSGVDKVSHFQRGLVQVRFRAEKPRVDTESAYPGRYTTGQHTNCTRRSFDEEGGSTYSRGVTGSSLEDVRLCSARNAAAGMTGLSGHSNQKFTTVVDLDYDTGTETVVTLRLVHSEPVYSVPSTGPHELTPAPRSNPVPEPV